VDLTQPRAERAALLKQRIRAAQRQAPADPGGISLQGTGAPVPSYAQERLWLAQQLLGEESGYVVPYAYRLRGPLDEDALERALGDLVRRHCVLRTVFEGNGGLSVRVIPGTSVRIEHVELACVEVPDVEGAMALAVECVGRAFDLATGPLVRALLVRVAPEDHVFVLAAHHIAVDGWSMPILWGELSAAYSAYSSGGVPDLPEPELQYADFAQWQRNWLDSGVLEEQLAHWRDRLVGLTPAEVPPDRPRPIRGSGRGAVIDFVLPAELAGRLRALGAERGVTLFMVLLAGWYALLARYSGATDLSVGTPIAGRSRPEVVGMVGFFVNTLVLRTDVSGDPGFTEILDRTRTTALDAYAHQDVPFERLVAELAAHRDATRTPFFQTVFSLDENDATGPVLPGVDVEPVALPVEHAKFDLSVGLVNAGDQVTGTINYATDLFDEATIQTLARHYGRILGEAAAHPTAPMSTYRSL
jgi:hypothetical protein